MATERDPFHPTHLLFGLISSPSEMCAKMQKIMSGFSKEHLIQYMDDLVIFSTDLSKLIELTADLLKRFCDYGLKNKPRERNLIYFVPWPESLAVISMLKASVCRLNTLIRFRKFQLLKLQELQSFLGLPAWCSKYCAYLADIAKPLFAISKVSAKDFIQMEPQHEKAFNHVKLPVTSSPCLACYDDNAPLELYTDSSEIAISAMLAIVQNDKRHPVAFWSRCINAAENNYSIYDKEFLALYSAIKQFRPFLLHRKFTVCLDNAGVAYLRSLKLTQSRLHMVRLITYLSEFMFEVWTIPSRLNLADALSRVRCND